MTSQIQTLKIRLKLERLEPLLIYQSTALRTRAIQLVLTSDLHEVVTVTRTPRKKHGTSKLTINYKPHIKHVNTH